MTNITHQVWNIIDSSPCIKRNMSDGLINTTALARYLIKEKKVKGTIDAISSAIRRYELTKYNDIFASAQKIVSLGIISTRSKLATIAVIKDAEIQKLLPKLTSVIQFSRGDVLRIIQADESIKILINEKNLEKILKFIPKNKIIEIERDLAELNMHVHEKAKKTPGILANISQELALNKINVVEIMSCFPELLWFVKEKDALNAYNILYQACAKTAP